MKNGLIVLSGGMDSTTLLYDKQDEIAEAVSFHYGSNHNSVEIEYAKLSCEKLGIHHRVIDLRRAFEHFDSALLSGAEAVPEGHYEDETMAKTVVPFRNGIMLSIAAGLAESLGLENVFIANHAGDHAVYPDCRVDFMAQMNGAILMGTGGKVHLKAPYSNITKEDIAIIGESLDIPWEDTYSCYKGGPTHCGRCSTCVERIWSLRKFDDPTMYLDTNYAKELLTEKGEW